MASGDPYKGYAGLLRIRQRARRRDARLSGGAFLISILATIGSGLLNEDLGRSIYLLLGLTLAFGLSFVMIWVRLEIIKAALELVGYLDRESGLAR